MIGSYVTNKLAVCDKVSTLLIQFVSDHNSFSVPKKKKKTIQLNNFFTIQNTLINNRHLTDEADRTNRGALQAKAAKALTNFVLFSEQHSANDI